LPLSVSSDDEQSGEEEDVEEHGNKKEDGEEQGGEEEDGEEQSGEEDVEEQGGEEEVGDGKTKREDTDKEKADVDRNEKQGKNPFTPDRTSQRPPADLIHASVRHRMETRSKKPPPTEDAKRRMATEDYARQKRTEEEDRRRLAEQAEPEELPEAPDSPMPELDPASPVDLPDPMSLPSPKGQDQDQDPEPKLESELEPKLEPKPESKPEPKPELKQESKLDAVVDETTYFQNLLAKCRAIVGEKEAGSGPAPAAAAGSKRNPVAALIALAKRHAFREPTKALVMFAVIGVLQTLVVPDGRLMKLAAGVFGRGSSMTEGAVLRPASVRVGTHEVINVDALEHGEFARRVIARLQTPLHEAGFTTVPSALGEYASTSFRYGRTEMLLRIDRGPEIALMVAGDNYVQLENKPYSTRPVEDLLGKMGIEGAAFPTETRCNPAENDTTLLDVLAVLCSADVKAVPTTRGKKKVRLDPNLLSPDEKDGRDLESPEGRNASRDVVSAHKKAGLGPGSGIGPDRDRLLRTVNAGAIVQKFATLERRLQDLQLVAPAVGAGWLAASFGVLGAIFGAAVGTATGTDPATLAMATAAGLATAATATAAYVVRRSRRATAAAELSVRAKYPHTLAGLKKCLEAFASQFGETHLPETLVALALLKTLRPAARTLKTEGALLGDSEGDSDDETEVEKEEKEEEEERAEVRTGHGAKRGTPSTDVQEPKLKPKPKVEDKDRDPVVKTEGSYETDSMGNPVIVMGGPTADLEDRDVLVEEGRVLKRLLLDLNALGVKVEPFSSPPATETKTKTELATTPAGASAETKTETAARLPSLGIRGASVSKYTYGGATLFLRVMLARHQFAIFGSRYIMLTIDHHTTPMRDVLRGVGVLNSPFSSSAAAPTIPGLSPQVRLVKTPNESGVSAATAESEETRLSSYASPLLVVSALAHAEQGPFGEGWTDRAMVHHLAVLVAGHTQLATYLKNTRKNGLRSALREAALSQRNAMVRIVLFATLVALGEERISVVTFEREILSRSDRIVEILTAGPTCPN
jgi:hypothetical protein